MAETIALTKFVVKIKHMLALMAGLIHPQEGETVINSTCVWTDNTATLSVAKGDNFTHETVKHVTVKVQFLQECIQRNIITIAHIKTTQNTADIMTKQLTVVTFEFHRDYSLGYGSHTLPINTVMCAHTLLTHLISRAQIKSYKQLKSQVSSGQECDKVNMQTAT
jgi:hypothetical protein